MFKFGPLHNLRHQIVNRLIALPVQTGDIFYRASNAKGPLGLPFSRLVALATKSHYTHAAIAIVEDGEIYLAEVNDAGTTKYRLIDWIDTCHTAAFSVYRLKCCDQTLIQNLETEILKLLAEDADYDFTFADDNKYYCTESVICLYQKVGIQLVEPEFLKQIMSPWVYWIVAAGSWLFDKLFGCHLPLDRKLYYVGSGTRGMIGSAHTECIYCYEQETRD